MAATPKISPTAGGLCSAVPDKLACMKEDHVGAYVAALAAALAPTNAQGNSWTLIGTRSGFEGKTTLSYTELRL